MKKKILFVATVAMMLGMTANSQTYEGELPVRRGQFYVIPAFLSSDGHTQFLIFDDDNYILTVYNHAFVQQQSISVPISEHIRICSHYHDIDANSGYIGYLYRDGAPQLIATQTLFNNDSHYEYILQDFENDVVIIKQDDGTVLQTISMDAGYETDQYASIIKFDGVYYLVIPMYSENDNNPEKTVFYRIDRGSQSIARVEGDLPLNVFPSVADRDQTITVELGEGNNATEVQVVNAVGQVVKSIAVQPDQREVQLRASDLGSGMHIVGARGRKGQGACKIIVK